MRKDIAKKLCERPRVHGARWSNAGNRKSRRESKNPVSWEDLPLRQSMRRPHVTRGDYKYPDDLFSPLYRFLEKNVGRPWNDVYSEICKVVGSRSATDDHVRIHTKQFVVEHPVYLEGEPYNSVYMSKCRMFFVDTEGFLREGCKD